MKMKTIIIVLIIMMTRCSFDISKETFTDENTTPNVSLIENVSSEILTHHHNYDNMDRGKHDYFDKTLVIEPNVNVSTLSRSEMYLIDDDWLRGKMRVLNEDMLLGKVVRYNE